MGEAYRREPQNPKQGYIRDRIPLAFFGEIFFHTCGKIWGFIYPLSRRM